MSGWSDQITAVILAGGMNSRFSGKDKAFLPVNGVPMVEIISGRLMDLFKKILVVTNSPGRYAGYTYLSFVCDTYSGTGPLGGIHAAMANAKTPYIFVVSCDMPFIDKEIIGKQADLFFKRKKTDALIPRINRRIEPLHAIYSSKLDCRLGAFLSATSDYSIRAFLEGLDVAYMDLPADASVMRAFTNVNSPQDLPSANR
jgi:molybdenum cofactor guanylyltransferase